MIQRLKTDIAFFKNSLKDWSTKRKIIVIESDDWGSIRMPSVNAKSSLISFGIDVEKCPFLKFDSFEKQEDFLAIESLFDKIFEKTGKKPKITANYILSNPYFSAIEKSNFELYEREFFWDMLKNENELSSYKNSINRLIKKDYFKPQLHGMEHVQVPYWMKFLKNGSKETLAAFNCHVYGISTTITKEKRDTFLAALNNYNDHEFKYFIKESIEAAHSEFTNFFGFKSKSFIAPNYIWSPEIEKTLANLGVKYLQSSRFQTLPALYNSKIIKRNTGEKNNFGQIYLVRNVIFEPSTIFNKKELASNCLRQIINAFRFSKPAIISMHRLNFMGGFYKLNREENLHLLGSILNEVLNMYPDAEFMSSDELGNLITNNKKDA